MIKDHLIFVFKSIRKRKLRSWLTMIGIFIGICTVVALIGLGEGLKTSINSQFGFLSPDIIAVIASGGFGPPGTGVVNPLTDKEFNKIKQIPGINGVAGRLLESAKVVFNKKLEFGYVVSMPDGEERKLIEYVVNMKAEKGRLLRDGESGKVFLGNNFNNKDTFGKALAPGSKIEVQGKEFEVVGIMVKKGSFEVDGAILMNDKDVRELFSRKSGEYDLIAARFNKNSDIKKIQADIEKELRKVRDVKVGEENFQVQTPASIVATVNSILLGVQIFVYIIASISLLVGGIGIMNTMYTAVVERTKDIGIMKAIGAKNSTIFSLFFFESGFLGAVGGIIGIVLGFLLANGLSLIGRLVLNSDLISANISWSLVFGALLFSFILGSFFGTLPAVQASKLDPVEALRFSK